jgi:hypothetical protein
MQRMLALCALLVACAGGGQSTGPQLIGEGMPILFIGNSHTYVNDVPGILQALVESTGDKIAVMSLAEPNLALIDHWNGGQALKQIEARDWTFVVMQQGWTPAGACQDTLRLAAKRFEQAIRSSGAQPALYQVWPPSDRPGQWQGTIESYRLAAKDVGGVLFPVAEAWQEFAERDNRSLYLDGLHANGAGSYLAALVMYARIFGKTPVGLPRELTTRSGVRISIPATLAGALQQVAADIALAPTPDEPPIAEPVITSRC